MEKMNRNQSIFSRLLPAALSTAGFAAIAHAVLVLIAAWSIGPELIYIAVLSFVVTLFVAITGGAVLLFIVKALKLKQLSSFFLFLISIQFVAIALEMFFFEIGFADISWQYGFISVPAAIITWYFSVFKF